MGILDDEYTDEVMKEIYSDYLESCNDHAPKEVIDTREALEEALENYIESIQEFEFNRGFRYAVYLAEKGVLQDETR